MGAILLSVAMALTGAVFAAVSDDSSVMDHLKSDNYSVTWGPPRIFDPSSELEIGDGSGHGFTLGWLRFLPERNQVGVLWIELDEGRNQYKSKWQPDRAAVSIKRAQMKPDAYAAVLRDLARVDTAKLELSKSAKTYGSSNDFWVYARLTSNEKTLLDHNWAGYEGSPELKFAKPRAAVGLARDAVKDLDFKEHTLTEEERNWASAKFARDWKKFKDLDFHWWVKERYIITIGIIGNANALPTLLNILDGDPKDRCVYFSINSVTRITKQDVRDKPVEEMDVEKTRKKVIEMLRKGK